MIEEERKYDVTPGFELPDLTPCVPGSGTVLARPARTLRATYYDTDDLRLARAGVSLRFRGGEEGKPPWTVKLPTDGGETRDEIVRPGKPGAVPPALVSLLTAYHRGRPLAPSVTVRTVRRAYDLRRGDGTVLAEVADDTVSVLDGRKVVSRFREIEVERMDGNAKVLDRVEGTLLGAGATRGAFVPKHVRAMGERAMEPADVPAPGRPPRRKKATAADTVTAAIRRHVADVVRADPYLRLRDPMPDGDTPVHMMRVACRRLRSDLRTFKDLVATDWADPLRAETRWLADLLGAARDAEVLRERLRRTAGSDPVAPLDAGAVDRIDAALAARQDAALRALDEALDSARYLALLDTLVLAAREPHLLDAARQPATKTLPGLVAGPWRRLVRGKRDRVGAGELDSKGDDDQWHNVRIRGKRARYAVEAVAETLGGKADALGRSLKRIQTILGDHQDAALAAQTWLEIADTMPDDRAAAVTAGRLYERERAAVHRERERFPKAWRQVGRDGKVGWLRPATTGSVR